MSMVFKRKAIMLMALSGLVLCGCSSSGNTTNSSSSSDSGSSLPRDKRNLSPLDYAHMNLTGVDELGRKIVRKDNYKENQKLIGIFYSLWHGAHETGIYDITKLESTPEGTVKLWSVSEDNPDSPLNAFHYWGEPLYGYYHSADPFVLRRHIELFIDAQIDYLCIDATNNVLYDKATFNLLDLLLEYQAKGYKTPKVVFYTNSYSGITVSNIYDNFYRDGKYANDWLSIDGLRPLIIGVTENNNGASDMSKYEGNKPYLSYVSNAMQQYFDVRESEWPNGDYNANSIPWMSWSVPQKIHETTGAITVDVAQHSHSVIYASSQDNECSRAYNNATKGKDGDIRAGHSFQDMWDSALERQGQIKNVLCTSWNEWMAVKQKRSDTLSGFVDVFDEEYSRDMEMENGVLGDNYYLQLLKNIRDLQLTDFVEYKKENHTIDVNSATISSTWDNVKSAYQCLVDNTAKRDYQGAVASLKYTDDSGRNDIKMIKVTEDATNLYFYIECSDNITSYNGTDVNYMNLFLTTNSTDPSFAGFNYVINRNIANGKGSIEKSKGGYSWEKVGEADVSLNGKVMQIAIPRTSVGCDSSTSLSFKVADHVSKYDDILDYYVSGNCAPLGRLSYGY